LDLSSLNNAWTFTPGTGLQNWSISFDGVAWGEEGHSFTISSKAYDVLGNVKTSFDSTRTVEINRDANPPSSLDPSQNLTIDNLWTKLHNPRLQFYISDPDSYDNNYNSSTYNNNHGLKYLLTVKKHR
jgi:hypothetical protein